MASQDQITWLDLRRFGADLALSEKNKYRERLSVLLIDDVQQAIALSNQKPDDFYTALKNNGFKIIPSEIPEHRNRMALAYHNPNGSSGLNPRNFQNIFLNMGRGDIKNIDRNNITPFTAPQQSHTEWRNLFLNNRTVYQKDNKDFYVVSCSQENTLKQEYDDFIQNSSALYVRSHQIDSLPMDTLSELGYRGNSIVKVYASKDAAYADGHDDSVIRKEKLSPFMQAVSVQENGTILAFEDLREVPEIFNHLPSEHPTWGDKAVLFADVDFTLNTLNRSAHNTLHQNKVGENGLSQEGIEAELEKLSQDLRDLNRIALSSLSFREPIKGPGADDNLYYLRKNKEDQQWYFLKRDKDGEFEKELLNPNNLFRLMQERQDFVESYVHNLSGNHPLSAENNQYSVVDGLQFARDYQAIYFHQEPVLETPVEPVEPLPALEEEPLEFNLNIPPIQDYSEPELPVIDNNAIDDMEPTSLDELIAKTNLRPASEMSAPKATITSGPSDAQVNEIVEGMYAQIEEEIEQLENEEVPAAIQASLDVDVDQPISVEAISNSIDNDALAFIQKVGEEERKKTLLAREEYLQNMQAALNGTFGTVAVNATLDEALDQIAPIGGQGKDLNQDNNPDPNDSAPGNAVEPEVVSIPGEPVTFVEEHQEFVQYIEEEAVQPISSDVILPVTQDGTQLDTVAESGSDTLVFENPNELYSELELVIQEATYVPPRFIKDGSPSMIKQVQTAQSYRLYAKLFLLPETEKEIKSLKELVVTLKNERDSVYEREMINNIGLSKDLYPYTLPESRSLVEIQDEWKKVQDQLSVSLENQDAILNRINRIDVAFDRSLESTRLVYSENEKEDQQALDDRVTKAYQTLFSNESYRQPEKLDLLVDHATRSMMESQYPSRDITVVHKSRLPRFNRKLGRSFQNSRFLKAKQRIKKVEKHRPITNEMPALKILHTQIGDHLKGYGTAAGIISDISVMLKGLENITGENQFEIDSPTSNLTRMMRDFAERDLNDSASTNYMNGIKRGGKEVKDAYGFNYSAQALRDVKDKLYLWTAAQVEESDPKLKETLLFKNGKSISDRANHENNVDNQIGLAAYFTTNFIPPVPPTLDGVKAIGWAMGRPGQTDQFKVIPYDLNTDLDTAKYQPMKSRNYEVALEESYDQFRLNYVFSQLNIEADEAPKIEQIAKLIRSSKPENEAEFKALSKELWLTELSYDDFKDQNFKLIEPEKDEQIADISHELTVGNTVISGLSGDELERLTRTTVLAKILADGPIERLDYDVLPEHSFSTAYAKTLEPSHEFKALREYFCPTLDDLNIKFENPTQYVNDMSERAVQAWNDLVTKLPEIQNDKLDIVLPTMSSNMDSPVYRLLPEAVSYKALKGLNNDLGLGGAAENWKAGDATIYLTDYIENFVGAKDMPISQNDALLLNVNGYIKALARRNESQDYIEQPLMYFPRLDNSQLSDEYKANINFTPKLFDFLNKQNQAVASVSSFQQAQSYNLRSIQADFLANLDYGAIKRETALLDTEPMFGAFSHLDNYTQKPEFKNAQSVNDLIEAQLKEPFVGVPMVLYKSRGFNANDLSHLRAVPSYVRIPDSSNLEPLGSKAILAHHMRPSVFNDRFDIDQHIESLKNAEPVEIPKTFFTLSAVRLFKDELDNTNHPFYDPFTVKADLDEVAIHEDMSSKMITDRNSLKDYYRESLIYQADLLANAVEKVKADPQHPKHHMPTDELETAHVYMVNYDDDKYPMLVVDHKDTNRHAISAKGSVYKVGTLDLANKANLELQADNITKATTFGGIVESNSLVERMVLNSTELTLSPLKAQDLDPNTTELVKARRAGELQNNIAWHFSHILNSQKSALGHALVMKPSTDTELARFKFVDVRQADAHKAIEDGWKVVTSHGFNSDGKKYQEVSQTEKLNTLIQASDLLPKDFEATRQLLSETDNSNGKENRGYFGDVGTKLQGAHKDRYGYNFSIDDIRQMSNVEAQSLVTKNKIWSKPDFKEVAARSGDVKFAIIAQAVYDMLPGKPKMIDGADKDIMKRVHSLGFYNDMISGVRNATNLSNSLTDFVSKLSQLSSELNTSYGKTLGTHKLDVLYSTKKRYSNYSVSSFLMEASSFINPLYNELRAPNVRSYPYHSLFDGAVKKATAKLINPKGSKHDFQNLYEYAVNDFSEDPVKDKQISKEFALYIQTGELTTNLIDKLSYYAAKDIKDNNVPIRTYEEVLAELPEITPEKEAVATEPKEPKPAAPDNSLDRDSKTMAVVTPVDGREGIIHQEVKSSSWRMLSSTRIGEDYRQGKNADAFDLRNAYGMNAVEFGNSTPLYVRQEVANLAFDAMRDLAKVLKLDESKISLGTGLAFASRGNKGAAAHYDSSNNIINLSGQNGAGSLAHEWFHSLDNYLGKLEKNYLLEKKHILPTATVNATHFLTDMVANGYEPRTPMAKMMVDIMESIRFKSPEQVKAAPVEEEPGNQKLSYLLSAKKSELQLDWYDKASKMQGTGPTFKVAGMEPKGNDLEEYLKWTLKKSETIAENYNNKVEKVFAKDAKLCKDDTTLNGFKYASDQFSTFIEKSVPQFGMSSVTTFVKTQYPLYSEKQRKEVIEGLIKDISSQSIADQMGGLHCKLMAVQSALYMRDQILKHAPDHLKSEDKVSEFVRSHSVTNLLNLPKPTPAAVTATASADAKAMVEKVHTDFYSFAKRQDNRNGKDYWATPWELFARTGEAYVNKKLEDLGFKNTFLASGNSTMESPILPVGPELEEIEKKVDALVEYVGQHILQSSKVNIAKNELSQSQEHTLEAEKDKERKNEKGQELEREDGLTM